MSLVVSISTTAGWRDQSREATGAAVSWPRLAGASARTRRSAATRRPMERHGIRSPWPNGGTSAARVAAVRDEVPPGLVLLSVGARDKVEKGFQFSIYRGTTFVGRVVVEKVLDDASGCRVIFVKEGEKIKAGDSAATRLQ